MNKIIKKKELKMKKFLDSKNNKCKEIAVNNNKSRSNIVKQ